MSYNVSKGVSGAASGAATGAAVGSAIPIPGVGTAVGATVGGLAGLASGFFGNDDGPSQEAIDRNRNLLGMLEDRYMAKQDATPTETALFEAGSAQAQEQARRQADRDAAQAKGRGLQGSQFAVAQDRNRAQQLGQAQRQLLVDSDRVQRQEERQALQSLLQQRGQLNNLVAGEAAAQRRAGQRRSQMVQQGLSTATDVALSFGGGGGGGAG